MARLITTTEAAQLTGYARDYVRQLVKSGKVKGKRLGRDWLIDERSLLRYKATLTKQGAKRGPKPKS